jgi:hypothetical protein
MNSLAESLHEITPFAAFLVLADGVMIDSLVSNKVSLGFKTELGNMMPRHWVIGPDVRKPQC